MCLFNEIKLLANCRSEHFSQRLQTPVHQVELSINAFENNIMATPAKECVLESAGNSGTLPASDVICDEDVNESASKKAPKKIPRPPNAFIIYRKEWHPIMVAKNPGAHNNTICESALPSNVFLNLTDFV